MNRADILAAASDYVTRDRAETHGHVHDNFKDIGKVWAVILGVDEIRPEQVALMMCAVKMVRANYNNGHADNWIDLAGYAACGGEIATKCD